MDEMVLNQQGLENGVELPLVIPVEHDLRWFPVIGIRGVDSDGADLTLQGVPFGEEFGIKHIVIHGLWLEIPVRIRFCTL
jgi:hypothetical protein